MASLGLLTMLDDIAALLDDVALMTKNAASKSVAMADDVAVMTKVATQKTAGVLGDDLALNAEQVTGVRSDRELPVVWAVAKGSFKNKAILVPAALLISAFAPWAINPLLMIGGAFLCYEGVEKVLHAFQKPKAHAPDVPASAALAGKTDMTPEEMAAYEQAKVKGAVRTDFILSAEIIVIALGTVASKPFVEQLAVLVSVALLITVVVYGLVAVIVRLDDVGAWLLRKSSSAAQALGRGIMVSTPWLMRGLSILGTAAMFLVGGSLLFHGLPWLEHGLESMVAAVATWPAGGFWKAIAPSLAHAVVGMALGSVVLAVVNGIGKLRGKPAAH